jgi:hypothetical protein
MRLSDAVARDPQWPGETARTRKQRKTLDLQFFTAGVTRVGAAKT